MNQILKLAALVSLVDNMSGPAGKVTKAVTGLNKAVQGGKTMVEWGRGVGVAGAIVDDTARKTQNALKSVMGDSIQLEDRMGELETVITPAMGSVEDAMDAAKAASIDWMKDHKQGADEFLQATYQMSSAGLDHIQSISGSKTALGVATATMGDATTASNLLAVVYNNLGDKSRDAAVEMEKLGDITTKTQQYFQISNLQQLTEGLKYAIPVAKQYGNSVEEVYTIIGALNSAGLQGGMAGTAWSASMRNMTKASKELGFELVRNDKGGLDFVGTLRRMYVEFGSFNNMSDEMKEKFKKVFGDEGVRAISLLLDQTKGLAQGMDAVTNSAGVTAASVAKIEEKGSARLAIIHNRFKAMKLMLADQLAPTIEALVPKITQVIDAVQGWIERNPEIARMAMKALLVATAVFSILAPILMVTSSLLMFLGYGISGVARVGKAFLWLGGKALWLSGKILLLAGRATVLAARLIGPLLGALAKVTLGMIKMYAAGVVSLVKLLPVLITKVWAFTAALLANPITWVIAAIMALVGAIALVIIYWDDVKAAVVQAWSVAVNWTSNAIANMVEQYRYLGQVIMGFVAGVWEWLKGIPAAFVAAFNAVLEWISGLGQQMYDAGKALLGTFVQGIKDAAGAVVDTVKGVLQDIKDFLPGSDAKVGPLSTLTASGQSFWKTWGGGLENAGGVQKTIQAQLDVVATAMKMGVEPGMVAGGSPTSPATALSGASGKSGERTVHIHNLTIHVNEPKDGKQVVDELMNTLTEMGAG